jgi:phosphatidate cytidylyltransferase
MVTGIFYVATLGATIGLIRDRFQGEIWVLMLLAMTWLNDTAAYFVGHWWGRRKLAPQVSPGKTREGFLGGIAGSLIGFVIVWLLFGKPLPLGAGLVMAASVGLVAPVGDLAESLLKRGFGAKDSGHIILGHGGLLDRIDALLFAAPVVYGFALQFS